MSKTTPCSQPPGGTIVCNDDQLAICGVVDGKIVAGCFDPPASVMAFPEGQARETALANWAFEKVTGQVRNLRTELSGEEFDILASGKYENPKTGEQVSFTMPSENLQEPEPQAEMA
jgi:hypothetical protein